MSDPAAPMPCASCGRPVAEGVADAAGWCGDCRRVVVRRATVVAHLSAVVVAGALLWWMVSTVRPDQRFVLLWLIGAAGLYFFVFSMTRRVAFEVIRRVGVRPGREG